MAHKSTAYLYMFFRTKKESQNKKHNLFKVIKEIRGSAQIKKSNFHVTVLDSQILIEKDSCTESWDSIGTFGICRIVTLEFSFLHSSEISCPDSIKTFLLQLLNDKVINVFRVIEKYDHTGFFSLKQYLNVNYNYYGYKNSLIFLFKMLLKPNTVIKHNLQLTTILDKYWNQIKCDEDILKISMKNKKKFLINEENQLSRDLDATLRG